MSCVLSVNGKDRIRCQEMAVVGDVGGGKSKEEAGVCGLRALGCTIAKMERVETERVRLCAYICGPG